MDRRNFFKIAGPLSITPFALNGFSMTPFASRRLARMVQGCDDVEERILVLVQLKGGNDGLNTVIPIDQYDEYANLRPTTKVPETGANGFINLDSSLGVQDQIGLHPRMTAFKDMYDDGLLNIIQGVGYQNMNQSHFKGTDIWLSGGDSSAANNTITTGWMGRTLNSIFPDVQGAPTPEMPDPLGIQLGDPNPSLGFHTAEQHQNSINLSGQDPAGFYSLVQTIGGQPLMNIPDSEYGEEIAFIQSVESSINAYAQRITTVFNNGSNSGTYPDESFANQLKTIARLVSGGCKTKIYLTTIGGFDTHAAQVFPNGNTVDGTHADLLQRIADGIKAFYDDLKALGIDEQITTVTFSEFGRCARENGSNGTDHGTLAPMFVFGKSVNAGVSGTNVNLSDLTNDFQLKNEQFDYRQVFATALQDWLGASNEILQDAYFDGFSKMSFIHPSYVVDPDCYLGTTSWFSPTKKVSKLRISPNPASWFAQAHFESAHSFSAQLSIMDNAGRQLTKQTAQVQGGADNLFFLNINDLPSGTYFVRLQSVDGVVETARMVVVK